MPDEATSQPVSPAGNRDFQETWLRIGGLASLFAAACFVASTVIQSMARGSGDTDAERLTDFSENADQLLLGAVLGGIGVALFAVPLFVLFRAAAGRSARVRNGLIGLLFIGPLLLGGQGVLSTIGLIEAGDRFVDEAPTAAPAEDQGAQAGGDGGDEEGDEENTAREQFAEDVVDDSSTLQTGAGLALAGALAFVVAMVYTSLWGMRTGLLTRFMGTLGMALGIGLFLLGPVPLSLWFLATGFLMLGAWPGGRPPAWEAGVAIPWPKPGQVPDDEDPDNDRDRELERAGLPPEDEYSGTWDKEEGRDEPSWGPGARPGDDPPRRKRKRRR